MIPYFYLQVTERCNMECRHCGFACTAEGQDMPLAVVRQALELAAKLDAYITIGGGEPTLHPQFETVLATSLVRLAGPVDYMDLPRVNMVTNGKNRRPAQLLAALGRQGVLGVTLSRDQFHEPISPEVLAAFQAARKDRAPGEQPSWERPFVNPDSLVELGQEWLPTRFLRNAGRCDFGGNDECFCQSPLIKPSGAIYLCGCPEAPAIGHVADLNHEVLRDRFDSDADWPCCRELAQQQLALLAA